MMTHNWLIEAVDISFRFKDSSNISISLIILLIQVQIHFIEKQFEALLICYL